MLWLELLGWHGDAGRGRTSPVPNGGPAHGHKRRAVAEGNLLLQIVCCRSVHSICFCRSCTTIVKTKSYLQIVTSGSADPSCFSRSSLTIGNYQSELQIVAYHLQVAFGKDGSPLATEGPLHLHSFDSPQSLLFSSPLSAPPSLDFDFVLMKI